MGWRWSVAVDGHGVPIGWTIDGANTNDVHLLEPTRDAVTATGLLTEIGTLHLDRGYDSGAVHQRLTTAGIRDFDIQLRGTTVPGLKKQPVQLGLRWIVEATNTWWSNYGLPRHHHPHRRPDPHLSRPMEPGMKPPIRSGPKAEMPSPPAMVRAASPVSKARAEPTAASMPDPHSGLMVTL